MYKVPLALHDKDADFTCRHDQAKATSNSSSVQIALGPSIRSADFVKSETSASVFLPATVAASISVPNNRTSQGRRCTKGRICPSFPAAPTVSATQPHTLHWPIRSCSLVLHVNDPSFPFLPCPNIAPR